MGETIKRIKKHKKAKETLDELYAKKDNCIVIHYSCESFYDIKDGRTPRITSIAVRYVSTGQTKSFSIHKIAEKSNVPFPEIEKNYDKLEKEMLKEFFKFLKEHKSFIFLHWNMRNINYGFEAIQHRYEVLKGKPFDLPNNQKVDLARLIYNKYSAKYASHPRLTSLMDTNNISDKHFLPGGDEANTFENKEYVKLHQSTLRKVDILEDIFKRSAEGTLKTLASWKDIYGVSAQGLFELTKVNWFIGFIYALMLVLMGIGIRSLF